ncbi:MAG TPA: GTPase HflX [Thermoanaerobacterales bacterium]|nr:GTPase HflX [Thermoanaerobacterales bacterium]
MINKDKVYAFLLGINIKPHDDTELTELQLLAKTAGAEIVGMTVQNRTKIDSAYYVGRGKAEEIAAAVNTLNANVIICDDELSPVQIRNLEDLTETKIVDRTMLILDIFAQRANTSEGKIQVELAQLQYMMPRLTGKGIELSQEGGGIGTRGPGETKLETDRRHIRRRVHRLKGELSGIRKSRQVIIKSRKLPVISLVGYTNAGKSTLMNVLTGASVVTGDRLFETLDTTTRRLHISDGRKILLSDTVGFIRKLPHHLVEAFKATLEEVKEADMLIHVADGSSPQMEEEIKTVNSVLLDIGVDNKPIILAINKIDKRNTKNRFIRKNGDDKTIEISALNRTNLDGLLELISKYLPSNRKYAELFIPYDDAGTLDKIHRNSEIDDIKYKFDGIKITGNVDKAVLNEFEKYILR